MQKLQDIKAQLNSLIKEYYEISFKEKVFVPGVSAIPVSGKVFDHIELINIVDSALDGWFTAGRFNTDF